MKVPKELFIQIEDEYGDIVDSLENADLTWSIEPVNKTDVKYVLADQWISAKEQSPEDFNNVLIVVDGEVMEGYFLRNHRGWYSRDGKIQFGVTHWQPLPEPPEDDR